MSGGFSDSAFCGAENCCAGGFHGTHPDQWRESDHGQENKEENNAEKNEPVKVMEIEGQQISAKESNNDIKKITISLPNDERRKGKKKLLGKKRRIKRKNFFYCVKKSRNKFKSNKKNNISFSYTFSNPIAMMIMT